MISKEELLKYIEDELTYNEIAKEVGVCKSTIGRWLKEYNIAEEIKKIRLNIRLKKNDLTGMKFNKLTALKRIPSTKGEAHYLFKCDCGTEKIIKGYSVRVGAIKSCGCLTHIVHNKGKFDNSRALSHIGETFNRLTIIDIVKNNNANQGYLFVCKCICGNIAPRVKYADLKNNIVMSCGCYQKEQVSKLAIRNNSQRKYKQWYYYDKNNKKIYCRSSYEVLYANWLTSNNIEFEYENKMLKISSGKKYLPDFYLVNEDKYIELKGKFFGESYKQLEKINILRNTYSIDILFWKDIVKYCSLPFKSWNTYTYRAKKLNIDIKEYLAKKMYL